MLSRLLALSLLLWAPQSLALGTLVAADGATVQVEASRTLFIRGADSATLLTQIHYAGTPDKMFWLIALPNVNDPAEAGVVVTQGEQSALDALAALTWPEFSGQCDGMDSGHTSTAPQRDAFGPTPNMALPQRIFTIPDIQAGRLADFATGQGITIDEKTQTVIDTMIDQNFMLAVLRIETEALGVNRIDPIVKITWPLAAGNPLRVPLFPTQSSILMGNADMVFWHLGSQRVKTSLRTEEIADADIQFISAVDTNYWEAFDATVGARQTQMVITEYASGVDGAFDDANLEALRDGTTFLTRLHARISPAAMRANAIMDLEGNGTSAYSNLHTVEGLMCGGEPDPDMGGGGDDMGVDSAPSNTDMAVTADMDSPMPDAGSGGSGGGDDGCTVSPTPSTPGALFALGLLLLTITRRRRR